MATTLPLIAIVGPTASGKTSLAIEVARAYDGEIICADSRTVYKFMDIGTAKPSEEDRKDVPHWGIDVVTPDGFFNAAEFQRYARQKITEIRMRNRMPILVGGTGLYIDSVLFDYKFPARVSNAEREKFDSMALVELYEYCIENNIELPENDKNKRHLLRSVYQSAGKSIKNSNVVENTLVVGLTMNKHELQERIRDRADQMFASNVVDETTILARKYGWDIESMKGNVYPIIHNLLDGHLDVSSAIDRAVIADSQLAKRQMTWFRRNPEIMWCDRHAAMDYLKTYSIRDNYSDMIG
jgi:tRNA dimethylallyltransferase